MDSRRGPCCPGCQKRMQPGEAITHTDPIWHPDCWRVFRITAALGLESRFLGRIVSPVEARAAVRQTTNGVA